MGWLGTWAKRKAIKYGVTKPGSSLTDFPLLIQISGDSDLGTALGATPKLALTLADGTTAVNHGRISWSYSGGNVTANIRAKFAPQSSASTGDVLGYIYYDSAQTDTQSKSGVLDGSAVSYHPLDDSPTGLSGDITDWSGSHNGTSVNGPSSATGKVGNCLSFDGTNDYVEIPDAAAYTLSSGFTISVSINAASIVGRRDLVNQWGDGGAGNAAWLLTMGLAGDGKLSLLTYDGSGAGNLASSVALSASTWYRIAAVYTGGTTGTNGLIYVNGSLQASGTLAAIPQDSSYSVRLCAEAKTGSPANYFSGTADELNIDNTPRSADWIAYDHQNQFNNGNTVTLGTEEANSTIQSIAVFQHIPPTYRPLHTVVGY